MSRVGKKPIPVPDKVKVSLDKSHVTVEGPLGRLEHDIPNGISAALAEDGKELQVARASDAKPHRELHGLTRTLISNMVVGVHDGYQKTLEIIGVGYSVKEQANKVTLQVGFSNDVTLEVPEGLKIEVAQATNPGRVIVSGCDKHAVGQFAARIRAVRPPEPYQGKGIRYAGEEVRRKAGKAFVAGG